MSYEFYKFLHLSCLALVLLSSGLLLSKAYIKDLPPKKMLTIVHGVSLLLFLIAGFGLLARTGQNGAFSSGWLWIKLITWGF